MQKIFYYPARRAGVLVWLALLLLLFSGQTTIAGPVPFGPQQIISTTAYSTYSVYAADLDGDTDLDVLSASANENNIAWYKNTDGNGSFGPQQVIFTDPVGNARSVYAADLDGDTDLDVLSASDGDNKIAWYENTDGNGSFGTEQVISTAANQPFSVYAVDLDGDIDLDVLSASYADHTIVWYKNTDGKGSFGPQQVISTAVDGPLSVYAANLDGDTDLDILSASAHDDKIAWYENLDGNGSFGPQQIISTSADGGHSVYAADLDGDTDLDVLSASYYDDKIAWYENLDGQGTFGSQQVINTPDLDNDPFNASNGDADYATSVYAADLDWDGDLDVLSASSSDNKIAWYENTDGNGSFGPQQVISTAANGAQSVYAADLDGDTDLDVLSASQNDDKIAWYENQSIVLVYLPIIIKPPPTILSVTNATNVGNITFVVRNLETKAEITRCTVPNGQTLPCDDNDPPSSHIFPPGTYEVQAFTNCPGNSNPIDIKTYGSGPQTSTVECQ